MVVVEVDGNRSFWRYLEAAESSGLLTLLQGESVRGGGIEEDDTASLSDKSKMMLRKIQKRYSGGGLTYNSFDPGFDPKRCSSNIFRRKTGLT